MPKRALPDYFPSGSAVTVRLPSRGKKRQAYVEYTKAKRHPRTGYPAQGTVGVPRPFPVRMVATLKYVDSLTINSSVSSTGNTCVACNSIFDPDLTGGGHQPYGHDTYSTIYNHYTVLKSYIKITPSTVANNHQTYGLGIEDSVIASTPFNTWAERPTYKALSQARDSMLGLKPLTMTWDRNKRFPLNDTYRELSAPFGSNPSEIEVFNIILQSSGSSTAIGNNTFFVEIWYTCEFYEQANLGTS